MELEWGLKGRPLIDCAEIIVAHYGLDITSEEYFELAKREQFKLFPQCRPLPGMQKIVHHLAKHEVPMAIATSSDKDSVIVKTKHLKGFVAFFEHIVSVTDPDVAHGKPEPDLFLVSKKRFLQGKSLSSTEIKCLVFEDAVAGVQAARSAGMKSVFIPNERMPSEVRSYVKPEVTLRSGHDFKPEMFGLPAFTYKPVTHVLFDVDGLLLDTDHWFTAAVKTILAKRGEKLGWEEHVGLMGRRRDDIIERLIENHKLTCPYQELNDEYANLVESEYPKSELMEGAERLIRHLYAHGVPIAVATSSISVTLQKKITKHRKLFGLFDHIVDGDHPKLKHAKPAPDIFILSASLFKEKPVNPGKCLVFEDSPNGVKAAKAAGMQSVMIPHRLLPPKKTLEATQALHSLADFRPEDFGLPPFED